MKKLVICRCEEVFLEEISEAIKNGAKTSKEVKLRTRAGMGICQGKTCRPLLDRLIADYTDQEMPSKTSLTHNFPARPITCEELAKSKDN